MARRFLICLAFAVCCFLNTWIELAEGQSAHFARYDPLWAVMVPVATLEVLLALAMFAAWEWYRRRKRSTTAIHVLFLLACLVPAGIAAVATLSISPVDLVPIIRHSWFWPVALLAAGIPAVFAVRRPRTASRIARGLLLYSWPVLLVIMLQAGRATFLTYPTAAYADGALLPRLPGPAPRTRVVWIIFDELSQTIAFDRRPANLALPNLDRLRAESFHADAAMAPGNATDVSLPALTLGEHVRAAIPEGPGELRLRTDSHPDPTDWRSLRNVFDDARDLGLNTAVVGWYHPYGRLLNKSLVECDWAAGWLGSNVGEWDPQPLWEAMGNRAAMQFTVLPLVGHLPGVSPGRFQREEKRKHFAYLMKKAREIVTDASIGLALIHLEIPHPPAIYQGCKMEPGAPGPVGYLDSVALTDCSLGALRQCLQESGLWERTAVLVSADHGWRTHLWRGGPDWTAAEEAASRSDTSGVPFLLKLPGQTSEIAYGAHLDTVVTRRLIGEILQGHLTSPEEIAEKIAMESGSRPQ